MARILLVLILSVYLTGCDAVSTVKDGFQQAGAVATELEETTGLKPQVGFNWQNGRLASVTIVYPRVHETKSLRELTTAARTAVRNHFKQPPENIVLSFATGPG